MEAIGDKIKRLRKNRGLSLMDLANILEVSDTALSKIETGKTKSITIDLGKGIAKALDISFGELFDIEVSSIAAELLSLKNEEFDNLNKLLNEKSLLIELLLKEKYNDKIILMKKSIKIVDPGKNCRENSYLDS